MGNVLSVSIGVCLEEVIVDRVFKLNIFDGSDDDTTVTKLALIALALKICADSLRMEYRRLASETRSPTGRETWHLPCPSVVPSSNHPMPALTFKAKLGRKNEELVKYEGTPEEMRSLFLADYTAEGSTAVEEVVVKFAVKYAKDAHKMLDAGPRKLAPKLHACVPVIGRRQMVVMERVKGTPLCDWPEGSLPETVFEDVASALKILHNAELVFGDLRDTNVMVAEDDTGRIGATLIDFDWVGEETAAVYPAMINTELIGKELCDGIKPLAKMLRSDDLWALGHLRKVYASEPQ